MKEEDSIKWRGYSGLVWEEGMEWNGMERNEKNNFKIFFTSLVWEF